jgi:predicted RNA-binding protein (virulence factor B family)
LKAVKQNGDSLQYASEELKNDKEVVLEAVKQYGRSLLYASEELKNDKEFVLEVVKQNGDSLEYASEELKNDKEVLWISKGYFKFIKSIKTFDLNFKFSKKQLDEIE